MILLLLWYFAVPAHLPIHFTTAIFSASTGGSQHVASSPVHEDQTIDHMWAFLLSCLVPSSYSSVFILLPHARKYLWALFDYFLSCLAGIFVHANSSCFCFCCIFQYVPPFVMRLSLNMLLGDYSLFIVISGMFLPWLQLVYQTSSSSSSLNAWSILISDFFISITIHLLSLLWFWSIWSLELAFSTSLHLFALHIWCAYQI